MLQNVRWNPLLLDVQKAYKFLDWKQRLELLRGHGLGLNLYRILENYYQRQRTIPKVGKYLGTVFGTGRGVTQGDPDPPMTFNIMVVTVVQSVLD